MSSLRYDSWPEGLYLYNNALTSKQSKKLYDFIDNQEWDDPKITRISREVQHYGFTYPYLYVREKKCKTLPKAKRTTPEVLICMAKALYNLGVLSDYPNQIIINKYVSGEGIGAHTYFGLNDMKSYNRTSYSECSKKLLFRREVKNTIFYPADINNIYVQKKDVHLDTKAKGENALNTVE